MASIAEKSPKQNITEDMDQ